MRALEEKMSKFLFILGVEKGFLIFTVLSFESQVKVIFKRGFLWSHNLMSCPSSFPLSRSIHSHFNSFIVFISIRKISFLLSFFPPLHSSFLFPRSLLYLCFLPSRLEASLEKDFIHHPFHFLLFLQCLEQCCSLGTSHKHSVNTNIPIICLSTYLPVIYL